MFIPEIITIPVLPFGMVNAHLLRSEAGCILIDAGIPGSDRKIGKVLARHGLTFRDIKLIVVTHAHTYHAGSAARVRDLSGAPILAHQDDADFYSRKAPMTYCTTGWVGSLFLRTPVPHQPYEGFVPDIMMTNGDTVNLLDFGVDRIVRHTGGHTPGSIAVELSSNDMMVGDLIASGDPDRRHDPQGPRHTPSVRGRPCHRDARAHPHGRTGRQALPHGPRRPAGSARGPAPCARARQAGR